jgi:hypothetical protein
MRRPLKRLFKSAVVLVFGVTLLATSAAAATPTQTAGKILSDLKALVEQTKTELKRHLPQDRKIASIQKFRAFILAQLRRQEDFAESLSKSPSKSPSNAASPSAPAKKPTQDEDVLALELIGLDQDLGGFMDGMDANHVSSEQCEGYQHNLIRGYSNSEAENPPLPSHAQTTLTFLQLLCSSK